MSGKESKKQKKAGEFLSWKQKKDQADKDEEAIGKEVDELMSWTAKIETMDDEQLKEYLLTRPSSSMKTGKGAPMKKARRAGKSRSSASSSLSQGLMASVLKFHKEEDDAIPLPDKEDGSVVPLPEKEADIVVPVPDEEA